MKTKLLLFVMLFVLAVSVNAQTKEATDEKPFKIGVGALVGLPMGDVTDFFSLAYGVDLMGEYAVASSFALTLSAGYVDFAKKSGVTGNTGRIPVLAGVKYYFSEKLYGSAQAGLSFGTASGSESAFTFAPGVGYQLSEKFDISLKYQSATKNSWNTAFLGLRAGLSF